MSNLHEIKLPSRIESVEEAAAAVDGLAKSRGWDDGVLFALDMAVRESVANAVKHGNKFDESKHVDLVVTENDEKIELTIRDYGAGFDLSEIPDPTDPENLLKASGRGLLFMNNFMDDVAWEHPDGGGTLVRMTKSL